LRYPGGKGKLAEYIKAIVLANDLSGGIYVEPYAGGSAVALELLQLDYVDEIHLNDLNRGVYAFWRSVLDYTDELVERIDQTAVTMDEWHRQKLVQVNANSRVLDLGFATFFLNRCNRSGILKAGVIGGKDQKGTWKLDARFNKANLIKRIQAIKQYRNRIVLHREDAVDLVRALSKKLPSNTLFYLDPPYYIKGQGLYDNFYEHEDHQAVSKAMRKISKSKWIVSYDDVPEIREMYSDFRSLRYRLSYSAQRREQGGEIMFFCPDLEIPEIPDSVPMHVAA